MPSLFLCSFPFFFSLVFILIFFHFYPSLFCYWQFHSFNRRHVKQSKVCLYPKTPPFFRVLHAYVSKQTHTQWIQVAHRFSSLLFPISLSLSLFSLLHRKISTRSHLGTQKRALCSSKARSGIFRRVSLRSSLFPLSAILYLLPSYAVFLSLSNVRAGILNVSACTYIRYLRAYIWVPIYRYQMVNERVDARFGRPQLAATQSFVYRGAVCATACTGWLRSVGNFFNLCYEI